MSPINTVKNYENITLWTVTSTKDCEYEPNQYGQIKCEKSLLLVLPAIFFLGWAGMIWVQFAGVARDLGLQGPDDGSGHGGLILQIRQAGLTRNQSLSRFHQKAEVPTKIVKIPLTNKYVSNSLLEQN